jgi:hypothetical protein
VNLGNIRSRHGGGNTGSPLRRVFVAAGWLACFALPAAGCGGGSSPSVANLGTTTGATTTTASTPQPLPAAGSGTGGHSVISMRVGSAPEGTKFAACMRVHGVPNFPDPNSQGVITYGSSMGSDPSSPAFSSARSACQKLLPSGGHPTPQQQTKGLQQGLAFSECMRAHGIPAFPDPTPGGQIRISGTPGSDLNPNDPQFQAAQQACQGDLTEGKLGPDTGPTLPVGGKP